MNETPMNVPENPSHASTPFPKSTGAIKKDVTKLSPLKNMNLNGKSPQTTKNVRTSLGFKNVERMANELLNQEKPRKNQTSQKSVKFGNASKQSQNNLSQNLSQPQQEDDLNDDEFQESDAEGGDNQIQANQRSRIHTR
jgi:hypothetical protein